MCFGKRRDNTKTARREYKVLAWQDFLASDLCGAYDCEPVLSKSSGSFSLDVLARGSKASRTTSAVNDSEDVCCASFWQNVWKGD